MLDWNEIVHKYITRHSNLIKKTTKPLYDHLGVTYFTYHKIDAKGHYSVLVDRPDWAEHYISKELYLHDPFLCQLENYQSGSYYMDVVISKTYKKLIRKEYRNFFNTNPGLMLIQRKPDFVEFYGFAVDQKDQRFNKLFLNQPGSLYQFCNYFKEELNHVLNEQTVDPIFLTHLKGEAFFQKQELFHNNPPVDFLTDIGMSKYIQLASRLTLRERQLIQLMLQGKSSKETGTELDLSRRTVESYFENIKNKLECWDKRDLCDKARKLENLKLLT